MENMQENKVKLDLQFFGDEEAVEEPAVSETPDTEDDFDNDLLSLLGGEAEEEEEGEEEQEEAEEQEAVEEAPEEKEETPAKEQPADEPLTARFLGKDIPLPAESAKAVAKALGVEPQELISTIQKGLNYDHLVQKAKEAESSRDSQLIDSLARDYGMSREQYITMLEQNSGYLALQQELTALQSKYPEAPQDLLLQTAQGNLQQRKAQAQERQRQEALQREQQERQRREPWDELFNEYPELLQNPNSFPKELMGKIQAGMRPLAAYQGYLNQQLQRELAAAKQNQKNMETTPGPMKGNAAPAAVDPFLSGLEL